MSVCVDLRPTATACAIVSDVGRLRGMVGVARLEDWEWLHVTRALADAMIVGMRMGAGEVAALAAENGLEILVMVADGPSVPGASR
jgi:hypothetical protein